MNLAEFAHYALACSFVFIIVAMLGDLEATRQMTHYQYRWVPAVRAMRSAYMLAALSALAFAGAAAMANKVSPFLLAEGLLVATLCQIRALYYRNLRRATLRGYIPATLMSSWLTVAFAPSTAQAFGLGAGDIGMLLATCGGCWFVAHQHVTQDLLRLRD